MPQILEPSAVGHIVIWAASDPDGSTFQPVRCLLGDDYPKPIRGGGGWDSTDRAGRRAVATWAGKQNEAVQIQLLLEDRRAHGTTVQEKWLRLEALCGMFAGDTKPPLVRWSAGVLHDAQYQRKAPNSWVIESLEWGDVWAPDGELAWAKATLTVALYEEVELSVTAARGFAKHTMVAGWDLRDFAKHYLGDAKRWKDVVSLNRDNQKCPTSPSFKAKSPISLLTPPKE